MSKRYSAEWSRHIDQIIRSRQYTRLAEGLAGQDVESALVDITADIMHLCQRRGISWETLVGKSRSQFEREEMEFESTAAAAELV